MSTVGDGIAACGGRLIQADQRTDGVKAAARVHVRDAGMMEGIDGWGLMDKAQTRADCQWREQDGRDTVGLGLFTRNGRRKRQVVDGVDSLAKQASCCPRMPSARGIISPEAYVPQSSE